MYMGPRTEDPPMASPPIKRKATSAYQCHAKAHPRAETRYRTARMRRLSRRPYRSPGIPAENEPATVPHNAMATVIPKDAGESLNVLLRPVVVPAMTAVSKPNSNPPSAATTVLRRRYRLMVKENHPPAAADDQRPVILILLNLAAHCSAKIPIGQAPNDPCA